MKLEESNSHLRLLSDPINSDKRYRKGRKYGAKQVPYNMQFYSIVASPSAHQPITWRNADQEDIWH